MTPVLRLLMADKPLLLAVGLACAVWGWQLSAKGLQACKRTPPEAGSKTAQIHMPYPAQPRPDLGIVSENADLSCDPGMTQCSIELPVISIGSKKNDEKRCTG